MYDTPQYRAIAPFWQEPDYFEGTMHDLKVVACRSRQIKDFRS